MIYREEIRDLFTVPDDYYLAHCISADFALGRGIAVKFDKRFDMKNKLNQKYDNYLNYNYLYYRLGGDCILIDRVLNLVTKERYWQKPTINRMKIALEEMRKVCKYHGIDKVAMPMIGSGLDRLKWSEVSNLIQFVFAETDIEILVCKLK